MKKWMSLVLLIMLVLLAACVNSDEAGEAANTTSEETTAQPVENSEEENETAKEPDEETPSEKNEAAKDTAENEGNTKTETTDETNGNSSKEVNYTAAENCIMTQLMECDNVPESDQFQAYNNLVADGTLPQAPGSGCLSCGVKYSFEMKYGESAPISYSALPHSGKMPGDINDTSEFVQQYLFSLPAYFNNHDEEALSFYLPESSGYNALFANKAPGNFGNHMTYSVFIDSEVKNLDGSMNVYATREYSHINTHGVFESYSRYTVIKQDGRYYMTDYEELENTRIE